jgi:Adenylate kinase
VVRLVLLGPPGASKGTQADRLASQLHSPHISTGHLFRAHLRDQTPLGLEARRYMDAGELVPDDVTIAMVGKRLTDEPGGFIHPRRLSAQRRASAGPRRDARRGREPRGRRDRVRRARAPKEPSHRAVAGLKPSMSSPRSALRTPGAFTTPVATPITVGICFSWSSSIASTRSCTTPGIGLPCASKNRQQVLPTGVAARTRRSRRRSARKGVPAATRSG